MRVEEIIKELRKELERIDKLILALESLPASRRKGRPAPLRQQLRVQSAGKAGSKGTSRKAKNAATKTRPSTKKPLPRRAS